jgi:hypothetical protein
MFYIFALCFKTALPHTNSVHRCCSVQYPQEHSDGTTEIDVGSTDLMDTAEDMADSMADVPAKDIKSKDDTTKVLGETVFKSGVEDMEELEAEDPFMEQPIEDLGKDSAGLSTKQEVYSINRLPGHRLW